MWLTLHEGAYILFQVDEFKWFINLHVRENSLVWVFSAYSYSGMKWKRRQTLTGTIMKKEQTWNWNSKDQKDVEMHGGWMSMYVGAIDCSNLGLTPLSYKEVFCFQGGFVLLT